MTRIVPLLLAAVLTSGSASHAAEGSAAVAALTVDETRELAGRWWRWRIGLPELAAPARDPLGRFCDTDQSGDTWFLAGYLAVGSTTQPTRRACAVPANRRIFFPLVTALKFVRPGVDCRMAKNEAEANVSDAADFHAKIDDVDLPGLTSHRTDAVGCAPLMPGTSTLGTTAAAFDGYWLMLNPLSAGHHHLEWGVTYKAGSAEEGQSKRTSYDLDVR